MAALLRTLIKICARTNSDGNQLLGRPGILQAQLVRAAGSLELIRPQTLGPDLGNIGPDCAKVLEHKVFDFAGQRLIMPFRVKWCKRRS